ncbi:ABC transporter permease [Clostridium botulinum]|uniref:ABC transporter permease n=1 Tax=Clostridium botulinum TaxID=1491 RepID=UPI0013759CB9|nr:ABC transporter permease [Clostridium botulinum]MCC5417697.1 ABC transporter permease [Clostridium botulinum]MCC5439404.1 ABC transporter permease [Clostridium botulinum]NCI21900.1 ABC transporter permease [Clostridium botulinum]NCI37244.1 ABC transporter permease [Clostridium botulinum]NCI71155.1 ABC transporter permease [Clostridium botulinum]
MEDFKILKFIDKFKFIYEKLGVNYASMRTILKLKLLMDNRRVPTIYKDKENDNKKNTFKKSLLLYGLMGVFLAVFIFIPSPMVVKMSINIGAIMFLIMTTMIADFSSVLLDIRDKNILNTKPLDPKTINAAKTTHILIYITSIAGAIAGPTLIGGLIKYKFKFFIIFFFQIILISFFTMFFTAILYYFILKIFDGEKLKDIINYFQIVLSVVLALGYQIIPRVFDFTGVNVNFKIKWWSYLVPPVWFGAPYSLIIEHNNGREYVLLSIMCVAIPIIIFGIYYKFIVPYFEENLQKLDSSIGKKGSLEEAKGIRNKRYTSIFCRDKIENVFFRFSRNMISTERKLKLKLYPTLAFTVIFPFLMLIGSFSKYESVSQAFNEFSKGNYYFSIYLSVLMLVVSIELLSQSEKYKGSWIYIVLPIDNPGKIQKGALKGFIFRYIFPVFLSVCIIFLIICGLRILPDIIVMFFSMMILIVTVQSLYRKELPFYKDFQSNGEGSITTVLVSGGLTGIFFGLHKLIRNLIKYSFSIYIYIGVLIIINMILWKKIFNISWKQAQQKDEKESSKI